MSAQIGHGTDKVSQRAFPSGRIAGCLLSGFLLSFTGAQAAGGDLIDGAKPLADLRLRYENVDDSSKAMNGEALTLRTRLGIQSGSCNGFSLLAEGDAVLLLTGRYNSTRNGKTTYPTIADPQMAALNRLQLTYVSDFATTVVIGRQRILFGDQRFVGNVGWRQHEQTLDAVSFTNTSLPGLAVTYAYVARVNRVFGPSEAVPAGGPTGAFHCDCHLADVVYSGVPNVKLESFAVLFDPSQRDGSAAAQQAAHKLSTATFGLEGSWHAKPAEQVSVALSGTYAHQGNYRSNPLSIDLSYWRGEGSISAYGLTGTTGYEVLEGNGTIGFATPLATLHAFNGWADLFLTTPANGLDDLYFKVAYAAPAVAKALAIDSLTASVVHHDFTADRTGTGIGTEWDGAIEFAKGPTSLLLKYAGYQGSGIGSGGFADKSVAWVQLAYKY